MQKSTRRLVDIIAEQNAKKTAKAKSDEAAQKAEKESELEKKSSSILGKRKSPERQLHHSSTEHEDEKQNGDDKYCAAQNREWSPSDSNLHEIFFDSDAPTSSPSKRLKGVIAARREMLDGDRETVVDDDDETRVAGDTEMRDSHAEEEKTQAEPEVDSSKSDELFGTQDTGFSFDEGVGSTEESQREPEKLQEENGSEVSSNQSNHSTDEDGDTIMHKQEQRQQQREKDDDEEMSPAENRMETDRGEVQTRNRENTPDPRTPPRMTSPVRSSPSRHLSPAARAATPVSSLSSLPSPNRTKQSNDAKSAQSSPASKQKQDKSAGGSPKRSKETEKDQSEKSAKAKQAMQSSRMNDDSDDEDEATKAALKKIKQRRAEMAQSKQSGSKQSEKPKAEVANAKDAPKAQSTKAPAATAEKGKPQKESTKESKRDVSKLDAKPTPPPPTPTSVGSKDKKGGTEPMDIDDDESDYTESAPGKRKPRVEESAITSPISPVKNKKAFLRSADTLGQAQTDASAPASSAAKGKATASTKSKGVATDTPRETPTDIGKINSTKGKTSVGTPPREQQLQKNQPMPPSEAAKPAVVKATGFAAKVAPGVTKQDADDYVQLLAVLNRFADEMQFPTFATRSVVGQSEQQSTVSQKESAREQYMQNILERSKNLLDVMKKALKCAQEKPDPNSAFDKRLALLDDVFQGNRLVASFYASVNSFLKDTSLKVKDRNDFFFSLIFAARECNSFAAMLRTRALAENDQAFRGLLATPSQQQPLASASSEKK